MDLKYKRMLSVMKAKQEIARPRRKRSDRWFLYVLRCADGSLYTGVTKDLERRFKMHSEGKGSKYTRTRRPLKLLYRETCRDRTDALIRECVVKAYPKEKKEKLVAAGEKKGD